MPNGYTLQYNTPRANPDSISNHHRRLPWSLRAVQANHAVEVRVEDLYIPGDTAVLTDADSLLAVDMCACSYVRTRAYLKYCLPGCILSHNRDADLRAKSYDATKIDLPKSLSDPQTWASQYISLLIEYGIVKQSPQ